MIGKEENQLDAT